MEVVEILGILLLLQVGHVFLWDQPKFAEPGQFPHHVSIEWSLPPQIDNTHSCGGAILSELWVLTSAYCVSHIPVTTLTVKAGFYNISNSDEYVQIAYVERTIVHKKYTENELIDLAKYDLGLMKLKTPLIFNSRVRPIKLPRKNNWFTEFKLNYNMILSGWGSVGYSIFPERTNIMRTVHLPVVPNRVCTDSIRTILPNFQMHESQLCTRPLDGSSAACIADYGGPLIQYDDNNNPIVVGVFTWSWNPCNTYGIPPIYTRVAPFVKWIDKNMANY